MSNVKIVMTSHGMGKVFIDERKIDGVFEISFSTSAGELNLVTLTLRPETVEIEGPARVVERTTIGDDARRFEKVGHGD